MRKALWAASLTFGLSLTSAVLAYAAPNWPPGSITNSDFLMGAIPFAKEKLNLMTNRAPLFNFRESLSDEQIKKITSDDLAFLMKIYQKLDARNEINDNSRKLMEDYLNALQEYPFIARVHVAAAKDRLGFISRKEYTIDDLRNEINDEMHDVYEVDRYVDKEHMDTQKNNFLYVIATAQEVVSRTPLDATTRDMLTKYIETVYHEGLLDDSDLDYVKRVTGIDITLSESFPMNELYVSLKKDTFELDSLEGIIEGDNRDRLRSNFFFQYSYCKRDYLQETP